jgi:hypothetical protein
LDNHAAYSPTAISELRDRRWLEKQPSTTRVKWLRGRVNGYVGDLAARAYFRLPCTAYEDTITSPKAEVIICLAEIAARFGLTAIEVQAAFKAEWALGIELSQKLGVKIKIIALSHIKASGTPAGIAEAFFTARRDFPAAWPHLTPADLGAIAAGFNPRARGGR